MPSRKPLTRARYAAEQIEKHRSQQAYWAEERARAIEEALTGGMTQAEVARELGISAQAVTHILKRGRSETRSPH